MFAGLMRQTGLQAELTTDVTQWLWFYPRPLREGSRLRFVVIFYGQKPYPNLPPEVGRRKKPTTQHQLIS